MFVARVIGGGALQGLDWLAVKGLWLRSTSAHPGLHHMGGLHLGGNGLIFLLSPGLLMAVSLSVFSLLIIVFLLLFFLCSVTFSLLLSDSSCLASAIFLPTLSTVCTV